MLTKTRWELLKDTALHIRLDKIGKNVRTRNGIQEAANKIEALVQN